MGKRKLTEERKIYLRWQVSEKRRKLKKKAIGYKGGSCERCGYSKSIRSLVFHHLNPEEKDFGISSASYKKWTEIQLELDKCTMLCANCHGEVHDEIDNANNEIKYLKMRERVPKKSEDEGSVSKTCFNCKKDIKVFKSAEHERNFCSRKCSDQVIYKTVWGEDRFMIELRKTMSIPDIAIKYGRSRSATYAFYKKIKEK